MKTNIKKGLQKENSKEYMRQWHELHPGYSTPQMHKIRFGGLREMVLNRDKYTCQLCGMTDKEHMAKWSRHLTIDHIDGKGRYSIEQNNHEDNLWTLCLSCHGRKDVCKREVRPTRLINLKFWK